MLARLLERILRRPPGRPAAPQSGSPLPAATPDRRRAWTPRASVAVEGAPTAPPEIEIARRDLEMELAIRCDELRDFLETTPGRTDAHALIDYVSERRSAVIRQP